MKYTLQINFGYFGARWACAKTTLVNFMEHFLKRQATKSELEQITGRFVHLGNSSLPSPCYESNYKNHADVWSGGKPHAGWGMKADPEVHGLINNWKWALAEIADIMGVDLNLVPTGRYQILVVDADGNPYDDKVSTHFIPLYWGRAISNPDPRLTGLPEVERRALPV